jgi:indole-3-glycerol phosphate synthase
MTNKKQTINQIQEQYKLDNYDINLIKELRRRIQNNPKLIITSIKKVSPSGMSRVISYNYFDKNNYLRNITLAI